MQDRALRIEIKSMASALLCRKEGFKEAGEDREIKGSKGKAWQMMCVRRRSHLSHITGLYLHLNVGTQDSVSTSIQWLWLCEKCTKTKNTEKDFFNYAKKAEMRRCCLPTSKLDCGRVSHPWITETQGLRLLPGLRAHGCNPLWDQDLA